MSAPLVSEPCALGNRASESREATRDLFGDSGVADVFERMSADDRAVFLPNAAPTKWIPERRYVAFTRALWDGPCAQDRRELTRWVDRITDRGFGRARRMIMSLASPWIIVRRAGQLWAVEHTHGKLSVSRMEGSSVRFTLTAHPFVEDEVSRHAISEAFRHIIFCCRVKWATETHAHSAEGLQVDLSWG